jgi:hypothetical protein
MDERMLSQGLAPWPATALGSLIFLSVGVVYLRFGNRIARAASAARYSRLGEEQLRNLIRGVGAMGLLIGMILLLLTAAALI